MSLMKTLTVSVMLLASLTFRVSCLLTVSASTSAAAEVVGALKPDTGTLVIESNIPGADLFINNQKHTMPAGAQVLAIALPPNTYLVRAARKGYSASGSVQVSIARNAAMMLNVYLKPEIDYAVLKIQGAMPGTQVKVDGTSLGSLEEGKLFVHELSPGKHVIELSKQGFLSKRMERQMQAGDLLALTGSEIQLASAPSLLALEAQDWDRVHGSNNRTDLEAFIHQYPASPHVKEATEKIRQALQSAVKAKEIQTEESDWEAVDKNSKAAVLVFLEKHPNGAHSGTAQLMTADLDRKSEAAELARAEEIAWKSVDLADRNSIQNYVRQFPEGKYKNEVERAVADLRVSEESTAILTLLRRYANAWSTKDLDSIIALQRNLNRRTVKEQLLPVRTIVMKISPVSPPQIEDARATVVCRRQVNEEFPDGIQKQSPELLVTFVLAKQNGTWAIESTR